MHLLPGNEIHSSYVLRPPCDALQELIAEHQEEQREQRKEWLDEEKLDECLRSVSHEEGAEAFGSQSQADEIEELQDEAERLVYESQGWCPCGFGST